MGLAEVVKTFDDDDFKVLRKELPDTWGYPKKYKHIHMNFSIVLRITTNQLIILEKKTSSLK